MSMNDIFNCLPKNQRDIIIKKFKPEYEKHIDNYCTPYLRKYNECKENKRKSFNNIYSKSYFIFSKEINDDKKELIEYDIKVMCKDDYKELEKCLNELYKGIINGMGENNREIRERLFLYLKYDYIKDIKN
jgi:hypothetical protein